MVRHTLLRPTAMSEFPFSITREVYRPPKRPFPVLVGRVACVARPVLRLAIAGVLLFSSAAKGIQLRAVPVLDGLGDSRVLHVALVEAELILGLWFATAAFERALWWVGRCFFLVAGGVSLVKALQGAESCGCFGTFAVNPWLTFAVDCAALGGLLLIGPRGSRPAGSELRRGLALIGAAAVVGVPAVWHLRTYDLDAVVAAGGVGAESPRVLLDPAGWEGRKFPLARWVDIGDRFAAGRWTVIFFRTSCSHCRDLLRVYDRKAGADELYEERVAFIEVPPHDPIGPQIHFAYAKSFAFGKLDPGKEWLTALPVTVTVEDGLVTRVERPDHR